MGKRAVIIFLAALLGTGMALAAETTPPNPWQGEWTTKNHDAGVRVRNCDAEGRCDVAVFGLSELGPSCWREGRSAPISALPAPLSLNPVGKFEGACQVSLSKDGDILKISQSPQDGYACSSACNPISDGREKTYRQRSPLSYNSIPGVGHAPCYRGSSASMQALCTDPDLDALLQSVQGLPFVSVSYSWTMDDAVLMRCDASLDVKTCLMREYQDKIKALRMESAKRAIAYGPGGNKADAKALLIRMAGVYKHRFKREGYLGEILELENVFEFVPVADDAAYLKINLFGKDDLACAIAGIAEYKKIGGFVFQDSASENQCLLTVSLSGGEVGFSDPNDNCQKFCGTTSNLTSETFMLKQKRTIRYMPVILKSPEYQQAMQAYQARHAAVKATP